MGFEFNGLKNRKEFHSALSKELPEITELLSAHRAEWWGAYIQFHTLTIKSFTIWIVHSATED